MAVNHIAAIAISIYNNENDIRGPVHRFIKQNISKGEIIIMKITGVNPLILTKNPEELVKQYEKLGFKVSHESKGLSAPDKTDLILSDDENHRIDIAEGTVETDLHMIRMNVSDFDEALELLKSLGYVSTSGESFIESATSKSVIMKGPTGSYINIVKHTKTPLKAFRKLQGWI